MTLLLAIYFYRVTVSMIILTKALESEPQAHPDHQLLAGGLLQR
jgi:hypothetical protein